MSRSATSTASSTTKRGARLAATARRPRCPSRVHIVTSPLRRPSLRVLVAAVAGAAVVLAVRAIPEPRPRAIAAPRASAGELVPLCGTPLARDTDEPAPLDLDH